MQTVLKLIYGIYSTGISDIPSGCEGCGRSVPFCRRAESLQVGCSKLLPHVPSRSLYQPPLWCCENSVSSFKMDRNEKLFTFQAFKASTVAYGLTVASRKQVLIWLQTRFPSKFWNVVKHSKSSWAKWRRLLIFARSCWMSSICWVTTMWQYVMVVVIIAKILKAVRIIALVP